MAKFTVTLTASRIFEIDGVEDRDAAVDEAFVELSHNTGDTEDWYVSNVKEE